jgi:hypothetical protein
MILRRKTDQPRTRCCLYYSAPIVRNSAERRELVMARWGMPTPPKFLEGRKSDPGRDQLALSGRGAVRPDDPQSAALPVS